MVQYTFKNLAKSDLVRSAVEERLSGAFDKFPDLHDSHIKVTLSMENSPAQAGPDRFTVQFIARGGKYRSIILKKSADNLYIALADLMDHLVERLNRYGDRVRMKRLKEARRTKLIS